ncbi:putative zinc-type alcohol dehydrogenase-like protein YjmD [Rubripirellula obstinata]|uniref:Putative zinc-type alcohol dehydrogenase-like protein YjmD n=1 Tax=Rubripirellula obstinata TaxID=406547 RepID=A0A5B1CMJ3_9BACT|nr:zinc-binding alcohol dehydrogenase family protein [Rubripirellula obstinata]KAA1261125.1 putative zinc-type alcohol dehydrogenase-like protein YjmD [Rubripirellula obstinata]
MKALQIDDPGSTSVVELDRPTPAPDEVLLKVQRVGLCGSDLSTFRGLNPLVSYPRIPGHEIGATIESIGSDVPDELRIGQNVLVLPYTACGTCAACRVGRTNCCQHNETLGVQRNGALSEFFTAPWQKLIASSTLSITELALVEPITVGFHAVARGRVLRDETVAVFGCGAIGLGVIAGAAARGAMVIAIDVDDSKLELGKKCGATIGINSQSESLHDRLRQLTDDRGPDVIVEAVGLPQTFRSAVDEVCFAGRVVYIGYAKAPVDYETKLFVMKEIDILGSRNALPEDFAAVIQLLESGKFPVDDVITATVPLASAPEILKRWSDKPGEFTKIHVDLS